MKWVSCLTWQKRTCGRYRWRYRIDKTKNGNIALGVSRIPVCRAAKSACLGLNRCPEPVTTNHPKSEWAFYGYKGWGELRHANQQRRDYVQVWKSTWCSKLYLTSVGQNFIGLLSGDILEVDINERDELSFIHNGTMLGVAFRQVDGLLYGAVSFGAPKQSVTILTAGEV